MSPPPAHTVNRVAHRRRRQLIHNSCALITRAKALIAQLRQSIARPCYYRIVCAWCHQTIR